MTYPPTTLSCEGEELACENQVGSLNVTTPPVVPPQPYVPPADICVGTWSLTGQNDICANNEAIVQASYVAESLNISGAPINIYPLLGVHQQGNGSVLSSGRVIGSLSSPGFPLTHINITGQSWRSLQTGTAVSGAAYVGIDFGIKLFSKDGNPSEYDPQAAKWTDVGCVMLTQSNNPGFFAQQVRVDTATGDVVPGV